MVASTDAAAVAAVDYPAVFNKVYDIRSVIVVTLTQSTPTRSNAHFDRMYARTGDSVITARINCQQIVTVKYCMLLKGHQIWRYLEHALSKSVLMSHE